MWIASIAAAILSLFVANSFYTEYMAKEIPWDATDTARDVGNFHTFAVAAELYMRDHAGDTSYLPLGTVGTSSPTSNIGAVVRWTDYTLTGKKVLGLSRAKGLPAGLATANIDPTWRIRVVDSSLYTDGRTYILCTGMTMGGVVKMANLPDSPQWNPAILWSQANATKPNGSNASNAVEMATFDVDANDQTGAGLCTCDPTMTSGATQCL